MLGKFFISGKEYLINSRILQIVILILFCGFGQIISDVFRLPISGSVIGLFILFSALASKKISVINFERGSKFLLAEMLLFFIPPVLGIVNHKEMIGLVGLKIVTVILIGTTTVMISTAIIVDVMFAKKSRGKNE